MVTRSDDSAPGAGEAGATAEELPADDEVEAGQGAECKAAEDDLRERPATRWLVLLGGSASSGLLLFLSDYPLRAWPLQLVALMPLLWALTRAAPQVKAAAAGGAAVGLAYTVPSVVALEFPPLMGAPLVLYSTLLWMLLATLSRRALSWRSPWRALAVAAIAVVVQWADCNLLPIWGTAQSFVRVWSAAPWAIQIVALTGMSGVVFVLVGAQAAAVGLITGRVRSHRRTYGGVLVVLLALPLLFNALWWRRPAVGEVRVAAVGWTYDQLPRGWVFEQLYRPSVERAAAQGARLVVSPEVGFEVAEASREQLLSRFGALARQHGIWLAVGYFDHGFDDNRIAFVDPTGAVRGTYRKTHLITGIEQYTPGDGELVVLPMMGGVSLGGLICQDDNFTNLSRGYGRRGVQLLAVPTNDWRQVMNHHLENALFRPIESGYGVVRAATNGVSVIASSRGEVLARKDHFAEGPGLIVADVPLRPGGTPYARLGDWLAGVCGLGLACVAGASWRRRRRERAAPPP